MAEGRLVKSHTRGQCVVATLPTGERLLVLQVAIDCPECGRLSLEIPGHHLRALRNLCVEFIDLYPDLTGEEAGMTQVKRESFSGTAPADPSEN
jgi:hypothetical protein